MLLQLQRFTKESQQKHEPFFRFSINILNGGAESGAGQFCVVYASSKDPYHRIMGVFAKCNENKRIVSAYISSLVLLLVSISYFIFL